MPGGLVYEGSDQNRHAGVILIFVLPTPSLFVQEGPYRLNSYAHFRDLGGDDLMADDRFTPLDPHPRVVNDRIVSCSEGPQDGRRDREGLESDAFEVGRSPALVLNEVACRDPHVVEKKLRINQEPPPELAMSLADLKPRGVRRNQQDAVALIERQLSVGSAMQKVDFGHPPVCDKVFRTVDDIYIAFSLGIRLQSPSGDFRHEYIIRAGIGFCFGLRNHKCVILNDFWKELILLLLIAEDIHPGRESYRMSDTCGKAVISRSQFLHRDDIRDDVLDAPAPVFSRYGQCPQPEL